MEWSRRRTGSSIRFLTVFVGSLGLAVASHAGFGGSAHDFSDEPWNPNTDPCAVCHTPHVAASSLSEFPLWNHAVTTATYTVYSSTTLNAEVGPPSGVSKLCLSCHDGSVAIDSYGDNPGTSFIADELRVGTDLSNDHPISMIYDGALAASDGGLFDPDTQPSGLGSTITADLLEAGWMECSSCHDIHADTANAHLLVRPGSVLCLTCHDK